MEILFSASSASPTTHSMLFYSIVQLNWRCVLAHFRSLGCRCIFPIFVSCGRTKLQRNLNGITSTLQDQHVTSTQKEVWFWRPNISNIRLQTNFTLDILHFVSIFKYVCVSWNAKPFYIRKKCTEFVFDTIQADANIILWMKSESFHDANFVVTSVTVDCYNNLQCRHRRQSWHHDPRFSLVAYTCAKRRSTVAFVNAENWIFFVMSIPKRT